MKISKKERARLRALVFQLERDPEALELVVQLAEMLAARSRLKKNPRRTIKKY